MLNMQTFITDHNMAVSASNLDDKRLGKQRVEALQIFECLMVKETRWKNHPAVKMWKGYDGFLLNNYIKSILFEWEYNRKFRNEKCRNKYNYYVEEYYIKVHERNKWIPINQMNFVKPYWITDEFIEAHRSNLIRKDPGHYRPLFPNIKEGLEYIWPV
jgi:hypothetical protein